MIMNRVSKLRWSFVGVALCLAMLVVAALARVRIEHDSPANVPVAVLDVGKVFRSYAPFNEQMAQLKREIEEFELKYRERSQARIDALQDADPERLAAEKTALALVVEAKKTEILERESRVYEAIYAQIEGAAATISRERNIGLVICDDSREKNSSKGTGSRL